MKLLRVEIIDAETCGGLLDGLNLRLRADDTKYDQFDPLCLVGPNGSGKSQFMQVIAEIFQTLCHHVVPREERLESNTWLLFEVEYLIRAGDAGEPTHVRATRRRAKGRKKPALVIERKVSNEWQACPLDDAGTIDLLPKKVVGYTSGDNETLSLPFLVSRAGYADEVYSNAIDARLRAEPIPDTRLMLIDYGTNLEVLVANQLLSETDTRAALLKESNVSDIDSCRCIIQLNHSAAPKGAPKEIRKLTKRNGVQLTEELERYLNNLIACATSHAIDRDEETYKLDFFIDAETRLACRTFWDSPMELYGALHKLGMLNDLVIPKPTRRRFRKETRELRFASRLPEPQDEDKVFRFEQVKLRSARDASSVDYVSLSDGEHQMTQILGTLAMQASPGVLFLLDEPESHFNPQWRVRFLKRILDLPTVHGQRGGEARTDRVDEQDCLLTTHAPFVPSDMPRERIFVFSKAEGRHKVEVRHPDVQTYGTTFDTIVATCFEVQPPISKKSLLEIETLMESTDEAHVEESLPKFGNSVEKAFLVNHLSQLRKQRGK
jgi:restriction system-associated AAA family ATPase